MAGVYIHIPFCVRRCAYCDFFSTTLLERREAYVEAVLKEIEKRREEAGSIRTIYIGGGTPSTLEASQIQRVIEAVGAPDATAEYLMAIREAGVNRLSIGIQSFQDELLRLIGRRHNAAQAIKAVRI